MVKYLPPYKPWVVPAVCSISYVHGMILLSSHIRVKGLIKYFETDYMTHWVITNPLDSLDNLDSLVFWGVHVLYWAMEMILFVAFYHSTGKITGLRESSSKACVFISTGLMVFYIVMVWCTFALAGHEGYHPMVETIYRQNHGPWHSISHLGLMVFYELIIIMAAIIMAFCGFLIHFSRQSFVTIVLSVILFKFHVHYLLWLID